MNNETSLNQAKHIYEEWDVALSTNDVEKFLSLYHPDAILESPLVAHLLGQPCGICTGKDALRVLVEILMKRKPTFRQYYRNGYFTDGKTLMWEYPRQAPQGEQMDFMEVMELKEGLIIYHRVYWGWRGVQVLLDDAYWNNKDISS